MTNQPQCPFCQAHFETVDLLTLHLIFDSCGPHASEDHPGKQAQAPAGHPTTRPELVPES
jgi:hypothetical protein